MKKFSLLFLLLGIFLFCTSCKKEEIVSNPVVSVKGDGQEVVVEEQHSNFYIEEYSVEDVLKYFNEVVLDTEYATGPGNSTLVQRWDTEIRYQLVGEFAHKDVEILESFFGKLNEVEGFPGAFKVGENEVPNLYLYFEDRNAFNERFGEFLQNEYADGAARYWYYTDTNDIYEGTIGYCTDMGADVKESVLLEELVNCLGIGDSALREDSIVYQYGSDVKNLSDIDWLIIQLAYHPKIRCGMDVAQCEEVIRELYY